MLISAVSVAMWNTPHSASAIGTVIFSDDFSSFASGGGSIADGAQTSTGLTLGAFRTLAGWTKSGSNGVHGVDRDITSGVNWAPSFWYDNAIEMTNGVSANANGTKYTVSFDLGPSVYASPGQATRQTDGMIASVLRANGTTLATTTLKPGVWDWTANAQVMTRRSFTYTGDGSGAVKLRFAATVPSGDRFGGAIDNVELRAGDECDPTSTTVSGTTVLAFTTIGTCTWDVPTGITSVQTLVVAGGGGGGSDNGGGGGAGGLIYDTTVAVTPGASMSVVVGSGGLGATGANTQASNGGNSAFGSLIAFGGGGGGSIDNTAGRDGGSAGGRAANRSGAAEGAIATTSPSQGNNGGAKNSGGFGGGGGGGASSAGSNGGSNIGGNGGAGRAISITGTSVTYAGGGGGGGDSNTAGTGGAGGGGNGSTRGDTYPSKGVDGLGGGGGAAGGSVAGGLGFPGGSGVVIIRYTPYVAPTTTTSTTTTTVRAATTTVAPALDIVVNAPATTSAPVGQSAIPKVNATSSTSSTTPEASSGTTTTTTTPSNGGGSVAPPAPKIGAVAPGEAAVTVGDKTETATVKRADNQVTVTAGQLSATLGSVNAKGAIAALDADGNVRLKPGDTVRIKLAGFKPGSIVEAWLFSTPQLMGTAKVGTDGIVVGTFTVPKNVEQGSHRIAVVAQTVDGKPATLAVGVMVGEWKKEKSITIWLIILPIVAAVFGALFLPAVIRRRRHNEAE